LVIPTTLKELGFKTHVVLCKNYLDSHKMGKPVGKCVLLHGPQGTGKTTLVNISAKEYDLEMIRVSTNSEFKKIIEAANSLSLDGRKRLIHIESIEFYKTKNILDLLEKSYHPVFLETTNFTDISYDIKRVATCVEVTLTHTDLSHAANLMGTSIGAAKNYYDLQSEHIVHDEDFTRRITSFIKGTHEEFSSDEWNDVVRWIADNVSVKKAADADLLIARYREVGASMENYMFTEKFSVPNPQQPWSSRIFSKKKKKEMPKNQHTGNYF